MKIAQINSVCGISSTGRIAGDIAAVCRENGVENRVYYGYREDPAGKGIKFQKDFFVHLDALLTRLFGHRGSYSRLATKKLLKGLDAYKPHVIHLHNIHGQYVNMPMLLRYIQKRNIPVLWTFHDCWPFTGDCFYFDKHNCEKWKEGCPRKCPHAKEWITHPVFNSCRKNYNKKKKLTQGLANLHIVTPSRWLESFVKRSFFKNASTCTVYNGIDLAVFCPVDMAGEWEDNKLRVLGICFSLDPEDRKGGHYLVELARRMPDIAVTLLGMDPKTQGLPTNVTCMARTNSTEELARVYSMADVFVNPTLEDNFPTVNIEALACGTPVITFRTGGSPEAVDEATGFVVEKGDLQGLQEALAEVQAKGKAAYTKACRQRAEKLYSRQEMCRQYLALYEKICGGTV